jgi:hypothetical protein
VPSPPHFSIQIAAACRHSRFHLESPP